MKRQLGNSDLMVTPVAMGCWPIAGMTSLNVNRGDSLKTLRAAIDSGINFFDTAFCYGADGVSEELVGQAVSDCRDDVVIATKCGVHWAHDGSHTIDGSVERIAFECDSSLQRLKIDYIDLMYLHRPDPKVPIGESASAIAELKQQGKVRYVAVSNVTLGQLAEFHSVCEVVAAQLPFNMLQQDVRHTFGNWCDENSVAIVSYWPLMKGLLAGRIRRDFQFDSEDKRLKYEIFQEPYFEKAQQVIDQLEAMSSDLNCTIAQLVIAWTIRQPGITVALAGAKRDWQISETAAAMQVRLPESIGARIDEIAADFTAKS